MYGRAAWSRLRPRVLTVTPGWSEAYGLFVKGEAPLVLSYTTSPAYHRFAEKSERYAALRGTPSSGAATVEAIREGVAETLIYLKAPILREAATHALFVNATSMADTDWESRRYMKLYVYWPMALHPHLKRGLLIAYGVGNTAKAMTDSAAFSSIDVVDISKDVLTGSSVIYPKDADNPLRDPRVRMHVEDGRYFLQTTDQRFDLITSEPPPPRSAGVVNLYTREYFRLIHARLADGGMAAYWLPTHTISGDVTRSVIKAFCDAFEDCSLWHGIGSELMLAGTRGATGPVSAAHFAAQWQTLPVLRELRAVGLERPEQLGALFIGDAVFLRRLTANTPPLVDDRPKRIDALSERLRFMTTYGSSVALALASPAKMARRVTWAHRHRFAEVNEVKAPALLVTGEPGLDQVVPVDVSRRYLDDLRNTKHVILERTGHNGLVTRPDDFAHVLGRFVDGLRLSA